jgi:glycosyltransferase involved in cell wall biosynthesis
MVKISVIVPIYKVPLEYLRACFDSLLAQTLSECEFIVVSDGAPEAECSICEEYATKSPRFKYFKREHVGVSTTRNFGINHAQGEYFAFVDSDDRITKDFCSTIWEKLQKWNSDILLFEQTFDNKKNNFTNKLFNDDIAQISDIQYRSLLRHLYFPRRNDGPILIRTCCQIYRAAFIKENKLQFNPNLNYSEDQFFNLNAFLKTSKISYLANPIYIQTLRNNSLSSSYKPNYEKEVLFYLNEIHNIAETNPNLLNINLFYNRTIQCILYTLDKCIYRPDKNISINQRKTTFLSFLNNLYCKESLSYFEKNSFSFSERIACYLCKKKSFWTLLLISKKWHIQRIFEK